VAVSGIPRVRRGLIQLAWCFLLFQKDSDLVQWFRSWTESAKGARKTKMIVALARKLLIALWRMVTTGEKPKSSVCVTELGQAQGRVWLWRCVGAHGRSTGDRMAFLLWF